MPEDYALDCTIASDLSAVGVAVHAADAGLGTGDTHAALITKSAEYCKNILDRGLKHITIMSDELPFYNAKPGHRGDDIIWGSAQGCERCDHVATPNPRSHTAAHPLASMLRPLGVVSDHHRVAICIHSSGDDTKTVNFLQFRREPNDGAQLIFLDKKRNLGFSIHSMYPYHPLKSFTSLTVVHSDIRANVYKPKDMRERPGDNILIQMACAASADPLRTSLVPLEAGPFGTRLWRRTCGAHSVCYLRRFIATRSSEHIFR